MDQEEWKRINQIVDTALELSKDERTTYIKEKCEGNEELRYRVTELLSSIEQSDTEDFLEGTKAFPSHLAADFSKELENQDSSLLGQTIGHYNIIELIGHGGMGSVFLAERADDAYNKQVAFKILRRGMDTPSNVARFKRERNILASLDHPNIARLLDGGVTQDGLPYLIMEHVAGTPLLEYCSHHRLSVEDRLELFKSVCQAVQHAHRNATIHRDLKPSNIFVTENGTVKVLDFGIAKLLEPENPQETLFQTQTGARMLTLGYAAPEQVTNETITTATDSYTLGILLYELLAGSHPFDMDDKELSKIEQLICDKTPTEPSKKFKTLSEPEQKEIASKRNTTPLDLARALKGDLDAIIMKALRKEPESRYPSVEQLLEDLNRYEQSRPLIAQSDTLRYRAGKFLRRNRNAVIGGFLILAATIGFGSYHINQIRQERNIAEEEAQKAKTAKNFLSRVFASANAYSTDFGGKNISAEELLLNAKQAIDEQLKNEPGVYFEISLSIGDVLTSIDAFKEAKESYQMALEISPKTEEPLVNKTLAFISLTKLKSLDHDFSGAQNMVGKANKSFEKIEHNYPALEARLLELNGSVNLNLDEFKTATKYFQKADSILKNTNADIDIGRVHLLTNHSEALIFLGEYEQAEKKLQQSISIYKQNYKQPNLNLANNYHAIGMVNQEQGQYKKAEKFFLKALKLKRKLTEKDNSTIANTTYELSSLYNVTNETDKAEKYAVKTKNIYKSIYGTPHPSVSFAKTQLGLIKLEKQNYKKAISIFQEVINERRKFYNEESITLAASYYNLATAFYKKGQLSKAVPLFKRVLEIDKAIYGKKHREIGVDLKKLAAVYIEMERYQLAKKYLLEAKPIFRKKFSNDNYRKAEFYLQLGKLKLETNEPQQAQQLFKKAHKIFLENFGDEDKRTSKAKSLMQQSEELRSS